MFKIGDKVTSGYYGSVDGKIVEIDHTQSKPYNVRWPDEGGGNSWEEEHELCPAEKSFYYGDK